MSELALSTRENSLQSMSSPNPATPPRNGACQWWALPKEISDEILQLAYGTPGKPISMLNGSAFECMQRDRIFDSSNDEKPFKPRKYERYTDRLLVSKKWLTEATEALFATTPVAINYYDGTFFGLNPQISLEHQRPFSGLSLVTAVHITSMDQAAKFARALATMCPRLRRLHVQDSVLDIHMHSEARWRDHSHWPAGEVRWTEEDVRGTKWFKDMAVLSGLESASLELDVEGGIIPFFSRRPLELVILGHNWALVKRLFVESATRPHDPAATREEQPVCRLRVPKST